MSSADSSLGVCGRGSGAGRRDGIGRKVMSDLSEGIGRKVTSGLNEGVSRYQRYYSSRNLDSEFRRITEVAKLPIAIVIVYAISFYMGWERPYWATVTAASVNLLSYGMTIYRGVIRVAGTVLGGITALAVISAFPQERWAYQLLAIIPLLLFGYGCTGKNEYLYVVAGITFCVVMGVAWVLPDWDSGFAHQIVMLRITQTWMGGVVMVLVTIFVWPRSSIGEFEGLVRDGWANQRQLHHAVLRGVSGADSAEEVRRLRLRDVDLQEDVHFVFHITEHDSYEVMATSHGWHEYLHLSAVQVEQLDSLQDSLADVRGLDLHAVLSGLDAFSSELERRFEETERMLAKEAPASMPQAVGLSVDKAALDALPQFQRAAVASIKTRLETLETVSRSLFDCVAKIRTFNRPAADDGAHAGHGAHAAHDAHAAKGPWLALDLDRVRGALGILVSVWIGFLAWIYVFDVPNHSIFWAMCGVLAFVVTYRFELRLWDTLWSWAVGTAVAGICYLFIMVHLDGFREFAVMFFIAAFVMGYVLYPRVHPAARMFSVISFTIILQADNQQHYSLEHYLLFVLWIWLTLSIALLGRACFHTWRHDKMFLLLFDRFFRHAHLLLSRQALNGAQKDGLLTRLTMVFFQSDLTELPRKAANYTSEYDSFKLVPEAGTINFKELQTSPGQVQELIRSLFLLAYGVKDLIAVRQLPGMVDVEEQLSEATGEWRQLIEEWFRQRAENPKRAMELTADLPARLADLESHIEEAFAQVDRSAFSAQDSEYLYRLLSSYRSLSEAVINHVRIADTFDWPRWRETRF